MKKYYYEEVLELLSDGEVHGPEEVAIKLGYMRGEASFEEFYKRVRGHLTYLQKKHLITNIGRGCWIIN